jgi:uncharacterized protein YfdQ (DUF2303 family)
VDDQKNMAETVRDLASSIGDLKHVDDAPYVVVPSGYNVQNLESMLPAPLRKRGVVTLHDVTSFCAYVIEHKNENTHLYFDAPAMSLVAVLDDHGKGPNWREHSAVHRVELSREWLAWSEEAARGPQAYAEFLEDRTHEVVTPDGAVLLELVSNFQASKDSSFEQGKRLHDGSTTFKYSEDITVRGEVKVPKEIMLSIPIVYRGPVQTVVTRFKFRLRESKLTLWHEIVRKEEVREAALDEMCGNVESITGLRPLRGKIGK